MGSNQEVHNTPKLSHLLLIIDTHIALSCRQKGILAHFIYMEDRRSYASFTSHNFLGNNLLGSETFFPSTHSSVLFVQWRTIEGHCCHHSRAFFVFHQCSWWWQLQITWKIYTTCCSEKFCWILTWEGNAVPPLTFKNWVPPPNRYIHKNIKGGNPPTTKMCPTHDRPNNCCPFGAASQPDNK